MGTCHKCGGSLARGNQSLARQCGACGTRYHASDCGGRLAMSTYFGPPDVCPKVRRARRASLPLAPARAPGPARLPPRARDAPPNPGSRAPRAPFAAAASARPVGEIGGK